MNVYETMLSCEYELISGMSPDTIARRGIVNQLLSGRSSVSDIRKYHAGISSSLHRGVFMFDEYGFCPMYPEIFIPPYVNRTEADYGYSPYGAKYRLVTGYQPKTLMLSANAYELGIMRLMALFAPEDHTVRQMCGEVKERLDSTVLGRFNGKNEYFCLSVAVLRFFGTAFPNEYSRIKSFVRGIESVYDASEMPYTVRLFVLLAYSDLDAGLVRDALISHNEEIVGILDSADPVYNQLAYNICSKCMDIIRK